MIGEAAMQAAVGCAMDATGEDRSHNSAGEVTGVKRATVAGLDEVPLETVLDYTGLENGVSGVDR